MFQKSTVVELAYGREEERKERSIDDGKEGAIANTHAGAGASARLAGVADESS